MKPAPTRHKSSIVTPGSSQGQVEARVARRIAQIRESHLRVRQRMRLRRILLRFDDDPARIRSRSKLRQDGGEVDRPVAWNGKDSVEHRAQEAVVTGERAGQ